MNTFISFWIVFTCGVFSGWFLRGEVRRAPMADDE